MALESSSDSDVLPEQAEGIEKFKNIFGDSESINESITNIIVSSKKNSLKKKLVTYDRASKSENTDYVKKSEIQLVSKDSDDFIWVDEEVFEEIEVEEEEEEEEDELDHSEEEQTEEEIIEELLKEEVEDEELRDLEEEDEEEEEITVIKKEAETEEQTFKTVIGEGEGQEEEDEEDGREQEEEEEEELGEEELDIEEIEEKLDETKEKVEDEGEIEEEEIEEEETYKRVGEEIDEYTEIDEGSEEEEEEEEIAEELAEEKIRKVDIPKRKKTKFITIKIIKKVQRKRAEYEQEKKLPLASDTQKEILNQREEMVDELKKIKVEVRAANRKNRILTKMICDYYRIKKDENVQQQEPPTEESRAFYYSKLKLLQDTKHSNELEIESLQKEIYLLQEDLQIKCAVYVKEKTELLNIETAIARNAITYAGKSLPETKVLQLIQRHESSINNLSEARKKFMKLQDRVNSIEGDLKEIELFKGDLSLMEYEQLKLDNQILKDKLEERENELINLRKKILATIHIHAHVREKTSCISEELESLKDKEKAKNEVVNKLRENVTLLKKKRDNLRNETRKLKSNSGLLAYPKLAVDFEETVNQITIAKAKLTESISTFEKQKQIIDKLRKQIQEEMFL